MIYIRVNYQTMLGCLKNRIEANWTCLGSHITISCSIIKECSSIFASIYPAPKRRRKPAKLICPSTRPSSSRSSSSRSTCRSSMRVRERPEPPSPPSSTTTIFFAKSSPKPPATSSWYPELLSRNCATSLTSFSARSLKK